MNKILFIVFLLGGALPTFATVYYVSEPTGSDSYSGTSTATAFKTIQKAANLVLPGDVVNVMNGVYTNNCAQCDVVRIIRAGTAANWITFQNYAGHAPVLQFNGWQGFKLGDNAAYIRIIGFEIIGNNANVNLTAALNQPRSCANPSGSPDPIYNGNGIAAEGRNAINRPHHLYFAHNIVHDCGGGGISAIQSDYVTVEDNLIYNNCWYTIYGTSGISFLQLWNSDGTTTTHNFVRRNQCFGNRLYVPWAAVCDITDGNGIIIDDSKNTQGGSPLGPYTAATRVENNIVWNNGGSGIHTYLSEHVTIINNTAYANSQSTEINGGEIFANHSNDIKIINNILWAADGNVINTNSSNTNLMYNYNLHWGGTGAAITGANTITANPQVESPDLTLGADFHLSAGSPATNTGDNANAAATDFDGNVRPIASIVDIGAYERTVALPVEYLAPLQAWIIPQQGIGLRWSTTTELQVDRFEIQRSQDGVTFEKTGITPAQGYPNQTHVYTWLDKKPLDGTNYYRLEEVDVTGNRSLSNVAAITWKPVIFSVFPSPALDNFELTGDLSWDHAVLHNLLGQPVRTFSFPEKTTLAGLPSGLYVIEIFTDKNLHPTTLYIVKR